MYEISIQIHLTITNGMSRYHNDTTINFLWGGGGRQLNMFTGHVLIFFHKFSLFLQVGFCFLSLLIFDNFEIPQT